MPNFGVLGAINNKPRAQSSLRRNKSQSYEKLVSEIKERTKFAIKSSAKVFRSQQLTPEMKQNQQPLPMKYPDRNRAASNPNTDSLYVFDPINITAMYKQPPLMPKILIKQNKRYSDKL